MRNIPHSKLGNICLFTLLDFLSLGLLIRLSYFTIWITAASLQAAFKALSPSSSTHENATALSTLPMMLCPRWALVSVLHQSLLCYPLHILCCPVSFYFFFLIFYCTVHISFTLLMIIILLSFFFFFFSCQWTVVFCHITLFGGFWCRMSTAYLIMQKPCWDPFLPQGIYSICSVSSKRDNKTLWSICLPGKAVNVTIL